MPTLRAEEPDFYNLDYYYSNYRDRFRLGITEAKAEQLKVLQPAFKPEECNTSKQQHFFSVPLQPSIGTCYCGKYHTSFTSKNYRIEHPNTIGQSTTTRGQSPTSAITELSKQQFKKLTALPKSPISKIPEPETNQTTQANPHILFPSYQTNPAPMPIIPHSQHYHTCVLCKTKNIPCVSTEQHNHAPDYTLACIFKGRLIHRNCTPLIANILITPKIPTAPFNSEQKATILIIKLQLMTAKEKIQLYNSLFSKKSTSKQTTKQQQQQQTPPRDTSNDLDWFEKFPITKEMETHTKFDNTLAYKIFDFIKPQL